MEITTNPEYKHLDPNIKQRVGYIAQALLGTDSLPEDFFSEVDRYIDILDPDLQSNMKRLLGMVNSRIVALFVWRKFSKFDKLDTEDQFLYLKRWQGHSIELFRTGFSSLKALTGWAYYTGEEGREVISDPGKAWQREDKTPTLLQGEHPYQEEQA